uniref:Beta-toxin Ct6 n=1 Tax=Centruroides tecomanus TaxID=1028682 RepID=SCX6_CENTE|nr:RecName: Full=Beta-toxin Ct6; Flags: Precursor [Centruroides tecomanus]
MKTFVLALCLVLIGMVYAKDGYLVSKHTGCKLGCSPKIGDRYCHIECTSMNHKGDEGYCYWLACYCKGMPENAEVYPLPNKSCGK